MGCDVWEPRPRKVKGSSDPSPNSLHPCTVPVHRYRSRARSPPCTSAYPCTVPVRRYRSLPWFPAPSLHPCTVPVSLPLPLPAPSRVPSLPLPYTRALSPCTVIDLCPVPSLHLPVHPCNVPVHRYRSLPLPLRTPVHFPRAPLSLSAPVPSLHLAVEPCTVPVHRYRSLFRSPPCTFPCHPCTVPVHRYRSLPLPFPVHRYRSLAPVPSLRLPVEPCTVPVHRYRSLPRSPPAPSLDPCIVPVHRYRSLPRLPVHPCTVCVHRYRSLPLPLPYTRAPSPCTVPLHPYRSLPRSPPCPFPIHPCSVPVHRSARSTPVGSAILPYTASSSFALPGRVGLCRLRYRALAAYRSEFRSFRCEPKTDMCLSDTIWSTTVLDCAVRLQGSGFRSQGFGRRRLARTLQKLTFSWAASNLCMGKACSVLALAWQCQHPLKALFQIFALIPSLSLFCSKCWEWFFQCWPLPIYHLGAGLLLESALLRTRENEAPARACASTKHQLHTSPFFLSKRFWMPSLPHLRPASSQLGQVLCDSLLPIEDDIVGRIALRPMQRTTKPTWGMAQQRDCGVKRAGLRVRGRYYAPLPRPPSPPAREEPEFALLVRVSTSRSLKW